MLQDYEWNFTIAKAYGIMAEFTPSQTPVL